MINHTSDSKQGHTPQNAFQLPRVTENPTGDVVSSQPARPKTLKIKKNNLFVTYVTDRLLLVDVISDGNI